MKKRLLSRYFQLSRKKKLEIIACSFIFISIFSGLISNYLDSKVMGEASLGVGIWADDKNSESMKSKRCLRNWADGLFYLGIICSVIGLTTEVYIIFNEQ